LEHHAIGIECLDLAAPWQEVESQLLDVINRRTTIAKSYKV